VTTEIVRMNSKLVVGIPEELVAQAGFEVGEPLEWVVEGRRRITLRRPGALTGDQARKPRNLDEIVDGIPDGAVTGEYDWGPQQGVEFW
jgi:antitoxin component of MazEF toxin-antitoxin module